MPSPAALYSAFGLNIASDIPLIELLPGTGDADVVVRVSGSAGPMPSRDAWSVTASPGEARGAAPAAGPFVVRDGREIEITPFDDADERALRMAIVGPLLGVILTQRGHFVLHASTVSIGGQAAAFVGPSGRGKSTLAAAMARAGHPLIADDMTLIETSGPIPSVRPGFPRVKLWPDSAAALDHDLDRLALIHPERTKRSVQLPEAFHSEPVPLVRCYLLEDGDEDSIIVPPSASVTVLNLIRYTYQASWMHDSGVSGANLLSCGELARSGIVRQLRRRRSWDALSSVIELIESDVRQAITA